jgi:hypothetical protein
MHRSIAASVVATALTLTLVSTQAGAQNWNDARSRALVERATERRAQQLADTGLRDYKALAHGYVTFLAQVGEGLTEPPKIVKADELVNEVYWRAPNLSKQRIVGRRDTLLLPTDIAYHRDHLGIVQNNFPAIIRLGEGDEVLDVVHPLSESGLSRYDFAITDSLTLQIPGRTIHVLEVKVRPKNDRLPGIVGALYLDDDAQVVRMAFNFTRAAFRDEALEDLFVVIENSLVRGKFWLPHRQEIEIQRGGTWLDYPIRGIIRGRWDIGDYQVNIDLLPALFAGPQEIIFAPKTVLDTFHFAGKVLDSLPPDVRAVTDADVRKVREEARNLVRAQALRRPQSLSLAVSGVSEFLRFDRAEGFAFGAGAVSRFGGGFGAQFRARYGVDDEEGKGSLGLDWQSPAWGIRLFGQRDYREAGDVQERSRFVNSIAAQEFGSDVTDPFWAQGGGIGLDATNILGLRWRLDGSIERQHRLTIRAAPAYGAFEPLVFALPLRAYRASLAFERPTSLAWFGTELRATGDFRLERVRADDIRLLPGDVTVARAAANVWAERPFGSNRLALFASGGAVGGTQGLIAQEWIYFGGPLSAPGYGLHELAATAGVTARAEWRTPVPAPSVSLGRFGNVPGQATLAPFVQAAFIDQASVFDALHPSGGYPSVGIATLLFYDILRVQFARGLRHGGWSFNLDVSREFWGVL